MLCRRTKYEVALSMHEVTLCQFFQYIAPFLVCASAAWRIRKTIYSLRAEVLCAFDAVCYCSGVNQANILARMAKRVLQLGDMEVVSPASELSARGRAVKPLV
jgi:hypothetical protein